MNRVAILTVGAAVLSGVAGTADWPQWRGPARDGVAPPRASGTAWPADLRPGWKVEVGIGHASPVVAGGRVYVFTREGEEEALQALDPATGKRIWRQAYPAPYTVNSAAIAHGPGPKATPTVAGGRVFTFGISGILSAFDAASGRVLWRKDFTKEFPSTSPLYGAAQSPLADGGRVIVHVGGSGGGALTAFDAATGTVAWAWKGDGPGYASAVLADVGGTRQVVTLTDRLVVGVAADSGRLLWQVPLTTPYAQNSVTPVVNGDVVIVGGLDQPVRAYRVAARAGAWRADQVWENADVVAYLSSPVLVGGRLFGLSDRRKGQFFCLDAATGRTVWLSDGRQGESASLVAAGPAMLVLTTEGELVVFEAAGAAFKVLKRYTVADTPAWAHLAMVEDGVLVKDERHLAYLRF
jgi:outer membrane protein assembly factor BamB